MSEKPNSIVHLIKGKLTSAIEGFVDTMNWIIDSCHNFEGRNGIKLTWNDDHPKIECEDWVLNQTSGAFRVVDGKIKDCVFKFGRNGDMIDLGDRNASDGEWYLNINNKYPDSMSKVEQFSQGNDETWTSIPLFKIEDGVVVKDYRGMPIIPAWDM